MKKLGIGLGFGLCLAVSTCTLEETQKTIQLAANLYCIYEPATSQIVGIIDTSSGTAKTLTKVDSATAVLCKTMAGVAT